MPRNLRLCPRDIPQHIVQRGNNRQICFFADEDFAAYAHWLHEGATRYDVTIHAWVFMTNHVHLLATPKTENATSRMMQYLGRFYVRYFNHKYDRSGTLWEGRYHSSLIEAAAYLLNCQRYIELNPVRAGMVREPAEYKWTSYHANGLGVRTKLHTPHALYLQLGMTEAERIANYQSFCQSHIDGPLLFDIRRSIYTGLLGDNRFRSDIEGLTGRCLSQQRRDPKRK